MRYLLIILLSVAALVGSTLAQTDESDLKVSVAEQDGIWVEARQAEDWETVEALTAPDFTSVPDGGKPVSREEWLKWVKSHPIRLQRQTVKVRIYGDGTVAIVTARESGTLQKEHGETDFTANTTRVWAKEGDDWKLRHLHFSWLSP